MQGVDEGREENHHGADSQIVARLEGDHGQPDDGYCRTHPLPPGEAFAQPEEAEAEAEEDGHFGNHGGDTRVDKGHGLIVESGADRHAHSNGKECGPHAAQGSEAQPTRNEAKQADFHQSYRNHIEGTQSGLDVGKDKAGKHIVQAVDHEQADHQRGAARAVNFFAVARPDRGDESSARRLVHVMNLNTENED